MDSVFYPREMKEDAVCFHLYENLETETCGDGKQSSCLGMGVWWRKNGLQRSTRKCEVVGVFMMLNVMLL